jgi:hypothetical protein
LFFLDYPSRKSKDEIWKIYLKYYGLIDETEDIEVQFKEAKLPQDENWTGSEIATCCRLAAMRKRTVAAIGEYMPTISTQAKDRIDEVREWAHGKCYAAEYEGIYDKDKHKKRIAESSDGAPRRRIRTQRLTTDEG